LIARTGGRAKGCIISGGSWYDTRSCARFHATQEEDGFSLESSKGKCAVVDNIFRCSSDISKATVFSGSDDETLTFYADEVPYRFNKIDIYADKEDHGTELTVEWQAA
ncbi:hypothetical protein KCU67_g3911, partial [Aureobasidium melanogenum]